jgi:hypothetical protein
MASATSENNTISDVVQSGIEFNLGQFALTYIT